MSQQQNIQIIATNGDPDVTFNANSQIQLVAPTELKVYNYRWVILLIFMLTAVLNSVHWIQYSIISNLVQKYYSVKSVNVDWLSIIFMLSYLPFTYPSMWLMDKMGLKIVTLLGSGCNCLGTWIKVVSVRPDLFYVTFIGQAVAGIGQVFVLNAPARIAAVWFGQDQVSTACSICVFGLQLGVALGMLLPSIIVESHEEIDEIGNDLSRMFYILAVVCSVHLLLVIFFFRDKPKLPPSPGQATRMTETPAFLDSLKRLFRNRGFVLLAIAYGIIVGVFSAFLTLLDQMVIEHFPGHEKDAGRIGLTLILTGLVGSVVCGVVLDKTHKFKATALALCVSLTVGSLAFAFSLQTNLGVIYGMAALLGIFSVSLLSVGFEFAAEITYPEPEGTTAGLINTSGMVCSTLMTLVASALLNSVGSVWSNVALAVMLLISSVMIACIKQDMRRQAAHALGERRASTLGAETLQMK